MSAVVRIVLVALPTDRVQRMCLPVYLAVRGLAVLMRSWQP
jgi:hypothetical protein